MSGVVSRSRSVATVAERGHERVDLPLGREREETSAARRRRRERENHSLDEFARASEAIEA
jgi:hypothetical protein